MNDRYKASRFRRFWRSRRGIRAVRATFVAADACQAVVGEAVAPAAVEPAAATSIATLLTRHIVRDGEVILLMLKPSLWTIFFATLPMAGVALIAMIGTRLWAQHHFHIAVELGTMLVAGRAGWAILNWIGKLYLLTDMRIVRISGVFSPQIHDIPLRKVARTRVTASFRERIWRLGSIEIIPETDHWPWSVWQTISRPKHVDETIRRAVSRAKQGGCYGGRL